MQIDEPGLPPEIELNMDAMQESPAVPGTMFEMGDDSPTTTEPLPDDVPGELPPAEGDQPEVGPIFKDGKLIFEDEEVGIDELKAVISGGKKFTQNMQQFRSEQQAFEQERSQFHQAYKPVVDAADFLNSLPKAHQDAAFAYLEAVGHAAKSGQAPPTGTLPGAGFAQPLQGMNIPAIGQIDPNELSDEGRQLYAIAQHSLQQQSQLMATIADQNRKLQELAGVIPDVKATIGELRGDREAQSVAATIKADWGVDIAPEDLRRMSKETGIQDMEAAFLKANKGKLGTQAPAQPVPVKPRTPTGQAAAPMLQPAPGQSTDEYFRQLRHSMAQQKPS